MATVYYVKCDKCGKTYSAIDKKCPNCGKRRRIGGAGLFFCRLFALLAALALGVLSFVRFGGAVAFAHAGHGFGQAALFWGMLVVIALYLVLTLASRVTLAFFANLAFSALFVLRYLAVGRAGAQLGTGGVLLWAAAALCFALSALNLVGTAIGKNADKKRVMRDTAEIDKNENGIPDELEKN